MSISTFSSRVRLALLKGMEAIGTSASNMASNAKLKANEINLENRRREILTNFNLQAFELWQKGVPLPEPLSQMLTELSDVEDRLSLLRAQKYAKVGSETAAPECPPDAGSNAVAPETPEAEGSEPLMDSETQNEAVEPEPSAVPEDLQAAATGETADAVEADSDPEA